MKVELTDLFLRSLTPPENGRAEYSDTKRAGLRLRASPNPDRPKGLRAVWMYEKRIKGGPKRKHTFGLWPEISLAEAREQALELELEARKGIDRVELQFQAQLEREAAEAGKTAVRDVLAVYDKLHLVTIRTRAERNRQLHQSLAPHLGRAICDLAKADIQAAVDAKAQSGRKAYANRIRAALVAFTRWAWMRGYTDHDIGAGIAKATKERARERVLSVDEVRAIWNASHDLGTLWGPLVRLLVLTGQRRGEILNLRWSEIDFDKRQMVKSGEVTKNGKPHITHLAGPALAELKALRNQRGKADLIFTTTGTTAVSGIAKAKRRLDDMLEADVEPWRFHDLRTAFATALAEAGEPETVVDRILNHSASGSAPSTVARVYNRAQQLPQRARALDRWAALVTGDTGNVVALHG